MSCPKFGSMFLRQLLCSQGMVCAVSRKRATGELSPRIGLVFLGHLRVASRPRFLGIFVREWGWGGCPSFQAFARSPQLSLLLLLEVSDQEAMRCERTVQSK